MSSNRLYIMSFVKNDQGFKGAVNSKGKIVIEPEFKSIFEINDSDELIPAAILKPDPESAMDIHWGYIDRGGNWKIRPQFDDVRRFVNEWAFAQSNELWGRIDEKGQWLESPVYTQIGIPSEGLVWVKNKQDRYTLLDDSASVKFDLDYAEELHASFNDGMMAFKQNNKWGYINDDGTISIQPQWNSVMDFNNELAPVFDGSSWKYINLTGKTIIEGPFDMAMEFEGDYAPAKKGKWGVIDKKGEWVIKPTNQAMLVPENNEIIAKIKGEWCLLNMQGEVIQKIPVPKKAERVFPFDDQGFAIVSMGSYDMLINRNFEVIFDSKKYKQ